MIVVLVVAILLGGCASRCPETAERELREHSKVVLWCQP